MPDLPLLRAESMPPMGEGAQFAASSAASAVCGPSVASVGDYMALMKPRVMSLVVFTALVSVMIAPGHVHPVIGFTALLCIAVGAGAAGALNMWYDADIDALMSRTSSRPIPRGRIAAGEALAFGIVLAAFAVGVLGVLVNWLAAALLAFTIFFYVAVYTAWLKRSTPHNIVIGGAAGSLPPVIGWAAVTGGISVEPCLLFLIIFFWTAVARSHRGLRPRSHSHAPGRCRSRGNAAADYALFHGPRADRRGALASRLCPGSLWAHRGRSRHADGHVRVAGP